MVFILYLEPESGMNLLEAIFSFLFGDGDPNWNLEQRRIRAIASLIRHNNYVVVAEQVRPYLDEFLLNNTAEYSMDEVR